MKLPKYRALALLGLLLIAGLIAPREGAAMRIVGWRDDDRTPTQTLGDPDGGGWGKGSPANFFFGANSVEGRATLAARIGFGAYSKFRSKVSTHSGRPGRK